MKPAEENRLRGAPEKAWRGQPHRSGFGGKPFNYLPGDGTSNAPALTEHMLTPYRGLQEVFLDLRRALFVLSRLLQFCHA